MFTEENMSVRRISKRLGVSTTTIWRWLEKEAESYPGSSPYG